MNRIESIPAFDSAKHEGREDNTTANLERFLVRENREQACFEAMFVIELGGIELPASGQQTITALTTTIESKRRNHGQRLFPEK